MLTMNKYFVRMKIDARYTTEVEADSIEEAKKKAEENFSNADFGEASDIDGDVVVIEDPDGNYLYEK